MTVYSQYSYRVNHKGGIDIYANDIDKWIAYGNEFKLSALVMAVHAGWIPSEAEMLMMQDSMIQTIYVGDTVDEE